MSATFLGSMIEFYGELSTKALARANAAQTKIEAGTYGPTQITSDALGLWLDGVNGWWDSALRPVAASLPVAFFKLAIGDASAATTVPVRLTSGGNPTVTDLASTTGGNTLEAAKHVGVSFVTDGGGTVDRTQLVVALRNLKSHNGSAKDAPAGLYQGVAWLDKTALSNVVVLIG